MRMAGGVYWTGDPGPLVLDAWSLTVSDPDRLAAAELVQSHIS